MLSPFNCPWISNKSLQVTSRPRHWPPRGITHGRKSWPCQVTNNPHLHPMLLCIFVFACYVPAYLDNIINFTARLCMGQQSMWKVGGKPCSAWSQEPPLPPEQCHPPPGIGLVTHNLLDADLYPSLTTSNLPQCCN